jgi:hypothetical protein
MCVNCSLYLTQYIAIKLKIPPVMLNGLKEDLIAVGRCQDMVNLNGMVRDYSKMTFVISSYIKIIMVV